MAILDMKKLKIIGLSSEKDKILDNILETKCVEIISTEEIDNTFKSVDESRKEKALSRFGKLTFAIDFIEEQRKDRAKNSKIYKEEEYNLPKKPMFFVRDEVSSEDFSKITIRDYELLAEVDTLIDINTRMLEIKAEGARLISLIEQLKIYEPLNIAFNKFSDSLNVSYFLGTIPKLTDEKFKEFNDQSNYELTKLNDEGSISLVFGYVLNEDKEEFQSKLSLIGFTKTAFNFEITAKEKIEQLKHELRLLKTDKIRLNKQVTEMDGFLPELKQLFDYYKFVLEKIDADSEFSKTSSVFILEGFIPTFAVDSFKNKLISKIHAIEVLIFDIEATDNPPTLCKNNAFVSPFESVTNMYSAPSYREKDPNMFVAIFFFLFFGLMLSDAGYGLVLAIIGFLLVKFVKLETPIRRMITLLALGGLSTLVWGALLGGWFAIDIKNTFLQKLVWFNPMEDPITMLAVCLALGILQILIGMGIKAKDLILQGKIKDALFDTGSWYLLFLGIGVFALSVAPGFEKFNMPGLIILLSGLLALILTQGRAQKSIGMKLFKGIGSLYGIVNYLSDILSYARLFGLGLATGVVGMVMNQLASVVIGLLPFGLGYIPAIAIIIGGHIFNLAISLLGAYVHNCRLQYIEFFTKFYEGGGHVFKPFGSSLKYTNIKQIDEFNYTMNKIKKEKKLKLKPKKA